MQPGISVLFCSPTAVPQHSWVMLRSGRRTSKYLPPRRQPKGHAASASTTRILAAAVLGALVFALTACQPTPTGKVRLRYWEKWTGAEGSAMETVVEAFNRSQDKIVVEYLSVSQVDRKTLLATAGGDPPDVAGLWLGNVYAFADADALVPLDDLIRNDGIDPTQWLDRYQPVYADAMQYRGRVWALPSTPSTWALHWNKSLFRAAGLDPERPPRTIAELDEFAEKLTRRGPDGGFEQMGFLPQEPGWAAWAFPQWFGGELFDGSQVTIGTRPENGRAYEWVESYTRKYGLHLVRTFTGGFGEFSSAQSPFFSGKIAMVLQGVWLNNFIRQYAPGLDYGVTTWPVASPGLDRFTIAEADVLVVPRGSRHPREAWQFIKYLNSANPNARTRDELRGMELVCFLQEKNSPLREWSPFFTENHPHPFIRVFRELGESPQAIHVPKMGIWQEYGRELSAVFDEVRLLLTSPRDAVAFCQKRVGSSWAWHQRGLERRGAAAPGHLASAASPPPASPAPAAPATIASPPSP
jgi:multiple sugar transport system substrate-binding protein